MPRHFSLNDQVTEVIGLLQDMERTYPLLMAEGKLDRTIGERRIEAMRAVLQTLRNRRP